MVFNPDWAEPPGKYLKALIPGPHTSDHMYQDLWKCNPALVFLKAAQLVKDCWLPTLCEQNCYNKTLTIWLLLLQVSSPIVIHVSFLSCDLGELSWALSKIMPLCVLSLLPPPCYGMVTCFLVTPLSSFSSLFPSPKKCPKQKCKWLRYFIWYRNPAW